MAQNLGDLDIEDVSLVKRAANGRPRFLILKSAEGDHMELDEVKVVKAIEAIDKAGFGPELEALAGADPVELATVVEKASELSTDESHKVRAGLRVMGVAVLKRLFELVATPKPVDGTPVEGLPGVIRKADGSYDLAGIPKDARPAVEMVLKTMDAQRIATEKRIAATEAETKKLVDERQRDRFIGIVKEFKALPGATPDDLAPALREISEKAPKAYDQVMKVLKASDEAAVKLGVLKSYGKDGNTSEPEDGSAEAEINSLAKAKVEKSSGKLTLGAAILEVAAEEPDLYRQYTAEQRAQS